MRWSFEGDAALFEHERPWLEQRLSAGGSGLERRDGRVAKWSDLRGRARVRHALRAYTGAPLPRLREYQNLLWLRVHGFEAPRPVLAGAAWSGVGPRFQFLCTEEVPGAVTFVEVLRDEALRDRAVEALARTTAALHTRGFVHRDLFARNVLAFEEAGVLRVALLDCWRGGAGRGLRGPDYDVGCFLHDVGDGFDRHFLETYVEERGRLGNPVDPEALKHQVHRVRAHRSARDARAARKRDAGARAS